MNSAALEGYVVPDPHMTTVYLGLLPFCVATVTMNGSNQRLSNIYYELK